MNMFDVIFLILLFFFIIKGGLNGIIKELADLVGFLVGFGLGILYYQPVGSLILQNLSAPPSVVYTIAFGIITIGIWSFAHLFGYLFNKKLSIRAVFAVRLGGSIISVLKFIVVTGIIVYLFSIIVSNQRILKEYFGNSRSFQMEKWIGASFLSNVRGEELKNFLNLTIDQFAITQSPRKQSIHASHLPASHLPASHLPANSNSSDSNLSSQSPSNSGSYPHSNAEREKNLTPNSFR